MSDEILRREALRLNDRYLREVVLAFGLCPWAEHAIDAGQVRRAVMTDPSPAVDAALPFIDDLQRADGADGAPVAVIGLLIFPRASFTASAFDRFTEALRRADRARRPASGGPAPFVMAAFHPEAGAAFGTAQGTTFDSAHDGPAQLVSFLRRTPDPTIQLVRLDVLERARAGRPGISDEIARQNHATVLARGAGAVDAAVRAIRRDRNDSYAALAVSP